MKCMGRIALVLTVSGLLLAACSLAGGAGAGGATATPIPTVVADTALVVEGRLVPQQDVQLSFKAGGQIAEVLVEEGARVEAGQVLARLDQSEQLLSTVTGAEVEYLNAQQAVKDLQENAEVEAALALQAVAEARDGVRYAQRYLTTLQTGSRETDIDTARANVVLLGDQLDKAQEDFAPYENKPEDNVNRAGALSRLADARARYDQAVRLLNNLQGTASEIDQSIADANLAVAQAQLALAEQRYELLKAGPDPDLLASTEARVEAAETALTAAQAALTDIELVAPFAGTVVDLQLKAGEQVAPGQPAVLLADFSTWWVETDDLTEIDVPQVEVGETVRVTPDAVPDLDLGGTVVAIKDLFEEKRGDITYTARIRLVDSDPRLRWGMTVVVTFE